MACQRTKRAWQRALGKKSVTDPQGGANGQSEPAHSRARLT